MEWIKALREHEGGYVCDMKNLPRELLAETVGEILPHAERPKAPLPTYWHVSSFLKEVERMTGGRLFIEDGSVYCEKPEGEGRSHERE